MFDARHVTAIALVSTVLGLAPMATGGEPPPSALPRGDLIHVVPAGTHSVWHRTATPDTALLDGYVFEVVDAVQDAQFDEFVFGSLEQFGADDELVAWLRGFRNMFQTVAAVVPWRELVQREFLYAETLDPPFHPDIQAPSMLLACRPAPARVEALQSSLASLLGSISAMAAPRVRYDIHTETSADGIDTTVYRLNMFGDMEFVQVAVHDGTFLLGLGGAYFDQSLALLRGEGEVQRLSASPRFRKAFGDLPKNAPSKSFLDVKQMVESAEDVAGLLADHEFDAGLMQHAINDAFDLVGYVDTITTATHCRDTDVITETLTRFDETAAMHNPMHRAGMAAPASSDLMSMVPADVVSFTMRGTVELGPLFRYAEDRAREYWPWADDALWAFHIAEAAVDLSVERDLLSWLGSEHISMIVPSRAKYPQPGETDSITICKLSDPGGARKVLARAEAVFHATTPRVMEGVRSLVADIDLPFQFQPDMQIHSGEGMFRKLSRLEVNAGPFPIPQITYGVLGDMLVITTSEDALASCMFVAAGEEAGLEERGLAAGLIGREELTSARLDPYGMQMAETTAAVANLGGILQQFLGGFASGNPEVETAMGVVTGLLDRVTGVLRTVDFLDAAVTTSESRNGGLARYERRVVRMLAPEARASAQALASDATTR